MLDYQATRPIQHGGNQSAIRARLGAGQTGRSWTSRPRSTRWGRPPVRVAAVREATEAIDRYPEPGSPRLIARLAEYHGVAADRIIVGAGTTELIGLIGQMYRESLGRAGHDRGGTNCGFYSFEQCQATVSGIGGFCMRNPFSVGTQPRNRYRH